MGIEKLGIKELLTMPCSQIKPSESCDYTAVLHEPLKQRERDYRGMLDNLIKYCFCQDETQGLSLLFYSDFKSIILSACPGKTWEDIKEAYGEKN